MAQMFYYVKDGQQYGPILAAQLKQLADQGFIVPADYVRTVEMQKWVTAAEVKGLFAPAAPAQAQAYSQAPYGYAQQPAQAYPAAPAYAAAPAAGPGALPPAAGYAPASPSGSGLTPTGQACPSCGQPLTGRGIVCRACGYNVRTGKKAGRASAIQAAVSQEQAGQPEQTAYDDQAAMQESEPAPPEGQGQRAGMATGAAIALFVAGGLNVLAAIGLVVYCILIAFAKIEAPPDAPPEVVKALGTAHTVLMVVVGVLAFLSLVAGGLQLDGGRRVFGMKPGCRTYGIVVAILSILALWTCISPLAGVFTLIAMLKLDKAVLEQPPPPRRPSVRRRPAR